MINTCREFELPHLAQGATAHKGCPPPLIRDHPLWQVGGTFSLRFWYQVNVKYHPILSLAVEKIMGGQFCIPYGRWGCCLLRFCYRVNAKNHPIPLLAVEVPLQTWIHCSPYERWVNLRSSYTHSRGKFSYDIENLTKNLYLRRLVQCDSCFLAGFLTLMVRDVFILEPVPENVKWTPFCRRYQPSWKHGS